MKNIEEITLLNPLDCVVDEDQILQALLETEANLAERFSLTGTNEAIRFQLLLKDLNNDLIEDELVADWHMYFSSFVHGNDEEEQKLAFIKEHAQYGVDLILKYGIEDAEKIIELTDEYGEVFTELLKDNTFDEAEELITEKYYGEYQSITHWAEEHLESTGELLEIPARLRVYFDYAYYARDCELSGDIFTIKLNGMCHVFNS